MNAFSRLVWLLMLGLLPTIQHLSAQNYTEIGTGTVANTMPVYSYWNYTWSSLIYNHTDLGGAKSITKIGLNCTNGPKTVTNQKIYYKLTSNSIFAAANYEDPLNTGYILIFQGNLTFQTGWNEITLTTPIPYDGAQNLAIHWENRWGTSYGPVFNSTASTINNNKNCGNDDNFPPLTQTGYLNPYPSSLTNMRFYYTGTGPATPTNPSPADNATVVSIATKLSWILGANTTSYDLYFGTDPLNLPMVVNNATVAGPGTYMFTPSSLLADSTMHYWKVVAKNGSQTETSPVWKFKTEVVIDQFPYFEGFEDSLVFNTFPIVSAWIVEPEFSWYQYEVQQHTGSYCAKTSWYTSTAQAILRSPKVLLPPSYAISYFWKNTSANKIAGHDTTYFEVSGNGGQSWVKVDTLAPVNINGSYVQRTHNLNAFAGNNCYFRFRHVSDTSSSACNVYLDDISIYQTTTTPTLTVTPPNQNVTSASGSTNFTVISNSAWVASSDQTWCTVTPSGLGNGSIIATYTENTSGAPRVANITVTVSGLTPVQVTVNQGNTTSTLSVNPANQNVTSSAGTTSFTVSSNSIWTSNSDQTWCTVTPSGTGNGSITANYTENTSGSQRVANITVTVTGLTPIVVTVTQTPSVPTLLVAPLNQNVTAPAGNTNFTVTSNSSWTASSDQSWCIPTTSGSGNGTLSAAYAENTTLLTRIANITVTVAGLTPIVVTVTQEAAIPFLSVTPENQDVTYLSGTTNFSVNTNLSWEAISDASWCVVTSSGTGNGVIFASYSINLLSESRIAHITISAAGVSPVNVTVTQQGLIPELSITPLIQNVPYQSGVTTFNISCNTNWVASSNAGWCIPTPSGTGSGVLNANYEMNQTALDRTAILTVNVSGLPAVNLQVNQEASPVGIREISPGQTLVYPNPTTGIFYLETEVPCSTGALLEIQDISGKCVYKQIITTEKTKFDMHQLGKGVYVLKCTAGDYVFTSKLIIK